MPFSKTLCNGGPNFPIGKVFDGAYAPGDESVEEAVCEASE
jgi:hypothetical protein